MPTKYLLEISAIGYWIILMIMFMASRVYIQESTITPTWFFDKMLIATVSVLIYYIIFLKKELKRLKSK